MRRIAIAAILCLLAAGAFAQGVSVPTGPGVSGLAKLTASSQTFTGQVLFASMPYMIAHVGGANAWANGVANITTFSVIITDTHSAFDGTTYTVPATGCYIVSVAVYWTTNATGYRSIDIYKNGGSMVPSTAHFSPGDATARTQFYSIQRMFSKGDTITVLLTQTSGGYLGFASNQYTNLTIAALYLK